MDIIGELNIHVYVILAHIALSNTYEAPVTHYVRQKLCLNSCREGSLWARVGVYYVRCVCEYNTTSRTLVLTL